MGSSPILGTSEFPVRLLRGSTLGLGYSRPHTMTRAEQHKLVLELKYHSGSMSGKDRYDFDMILKRDKDDEDLDVIAQKTLDRLASLYMPKKSKKDVEELWKKLTSGKSTPGSA